MIQSLLSFLPVALLGFFFLLCLWPLQHPTLSNLLIKGILATGLGLGISSCLVFVSLILLDSLRTEIFWIEMLLLAILAGGALRGIKARKDGPSDERAAISGRLLVVQKLSQPDFVLLLQRAFFFSQFARCRNHTDHMMLGQSGICVRDISLGLKANGEMRSRNSCSIQITPCLSPRLLPEGGCGWVLRQ